MTNIGNGMIAVPVLALKIYRYQNSFKCLLGNDSVNIRGIAPILPSKRVRWTESFDFPGRQNSFLPVIPARRAVTCTPCRRQAC